MKNPLEILNIYQTRKKCRKAAESFAHASEYDDDILSDEQKIKLTKKILEAVDLLDKNDFDGMKKYTKNANRDLAAILDRSNMGLREILDILAVALAVAFGIRALFFQPFKIPTGSMQPTLFGIHFIEKEPLGNKFLGKFGSLADSLLFSCERVSTEIVKDGRIESYAPANTLFSTRTRLTIGGADYILPGNINKIAEYAKLDPEKIYRKGEKLCDGYLSSGDHLFVDRLSHYLFGLKRGDITVFTTENIFINNEPLSESSGFYYVKRLVGMPGDTLKIENEMLYIKEKGSDTFRPITDFSDKFAKIYSKQGGYQGHSSIVGYEHGKYLAFASDEFTVPENSYFMLGDNTKFSADSRVWGVVPRKNIVGRPILVFWPFSRRWGFGECDEALPIPTSNAEFNTFREMYQQ